MPQVPPQDLGTQRTAKASERVKKKHVPILDKKLPISPQNTAPKAEIRQLVSCQPGSFYHICHLKISLASSRDKTFSCQINSWGPAEALAT